MGKKAWERREKEEKCLLVKIQLHSQNKWNKWYVDRGCSSHMTWTKPNFSLWRKYRYNSFSSLLDFNVVYYKWNNYGNIACCSRSGIVESHRYYREENILSKKKGIHRSVGNEKWERIKKKREMYAHTIALYAKNKGNKWYVDSRYSSHMTRNQTKFVPLKKEN